MSEVFKVPAPVGEKRRVKRSLSPQPSTSKAPVPPAPSPSTALLHPASPANAPNSVSESVYDHVDKNFISLNQIGQLKGLKAGRRRGRWCRMHRINQVQNTETIFSLRDNEGLNTLERLVHQEMKKQQNLQLFIASGLNHFAKTVTDIVDKLEGKEPSEWTSEPEATKKSADKYAGWFNKIPIVPESQTTDLATAEEINRRLLEETEAAVEALLTGDRTKEYVSESYTFIVEVFKAIAAAKAFENMDTVTYA